MPRISYLLISPHVILNYRQLRKSEYELVRTTNRCWHLRLIRLGYGLGTCGNQAITCLLSSNVSWIQMKTMRVMTQAQLLKLILCSLTYTMFRLTIDDRSYIFNLAVNPAGTLEI